jgi:uncharacterized coiled-coil DUF342 family protein
VAPRAYLSEEAEAEEAEDREKLRALRARLRELVERRGRALQEVRKIADEQDALYQARQPGEREVDRIHQEYRGLGDALVAARHRREAARAAADEAIASLREFQALNPPGEVARPEAIRREIAELEHRQQTRALPLAEENALIDRLRSLARKAVEAEKDKGRSEARRKQIAELEAALMARRKELKEASEALPRLRNERDAKLQSIRGRLEQAGQLMAEIREKARAKAGALDRLRAIGDEIDKAEREADQLMRSSRGRQDEARRAIGEYRRGVQGQRPVDAGQAADRQLEELLKRGKVTLRG